MIEVYYPKIKDIPTIILLFPFFFILMYFDTVNLSISPDLLWKLPLVLLILGYMLFKKRNLQFPAYFIFGILLAIKQILVLTPKLSYYTKAAAMGSLDLIVPVLTLFFIRFCSYKKIGKFIFFLSCWIIISTLPYHLGILKNDIVSGDPDYNLAKYGASGYLFTGPFLSIHDAAITLSFALVGILSFYNKARSKIVKAWISFLALIALISIYYTYVRTAMVMLLIGFIIQNFVGRGKSQLVKGISIMFLAFLFFYIIYLNSPILQMRLNNTNAVGGKSLSEGSGRLVFWATMLHYSVSNGIIKFFVGTGREAGMDYMSSQIGRRLFSHNGFIDILVSAGALGLLLFFIFQRNLFKRIFKWKNRNTLPSYRLVLIALLMYWVAMMFQSHQFFWVFIMIALFVAYLEKEYRYYNE